jgi:DtxR family Mn-dependent transcriptional regulator
LLFIFEQQKTLHQLVIPIQKSDGNMKKGNSEKHEVALTTLKKGEIATVSCIRVGRGKGRVFEKRLMDMGLTPGNEVSVVKSAPFHGPMEICVRGSRLAVGRGMAERIFVEKDKE